MGKILKKENYINKKYNNLTILEISDYKDKQGKTKHKCLCLCVCNNKKEFRLDTVIYGVAKSCGCLSSDTYKLNIDKARKSKNSNSYYEKAILNIGHKYNKLKIIDVIFNKNIKGYYMKCECECGKITEQKLWELKNGRVMSCGCHQKEQASINGSNIGLNNFKSKYKWYFTKNGEKIFCRSGFEVIYANYLIKNNIDFEYEPCCFKLDNGKRYTPDFYLINEDEYIEIKGSFEVNKQYNHQEDNTKLFNDKYKLNILYWKDLVKVCNLKFKSYNTYLNQARRLCVKEEDFLNKI